MKYTFMSDIHIGCDQCIEDLFEKAVKDQKNKNIVFTGDMFDCGLKGDMRFDQTRTIDDSIEYAYNILKGNSRVLGFLTGNHERRIIRETSLDPLKILSDRLKKKYFGVSVHLDQTFVTHGSGSAQTVDGEFTKWLKHTGEKFIVRGHTHKLYWHPFVNQDGVRIGINSGCFKVESEYELDKAYSTSIGYVRLDTSKSWNKAVQLVI